MEQSESERYEKLGLWEALNRPYHYPLACRELSAILRNAYSQLPKHVQSLIFQDTLLAFRLLPELQMQASISAANALLQSMEAALPKQKRNLATREFKHAIIAHKRRVKDNSDGKGPIQLPQDVLAHIFQFLDIQTLLSAALVCRFLKSMQMARSWNEAASDNHLWQLIYTNFFGTFANFSNDVGCRSYTSAKDVQNICQEETNALRSVDWKNVFKRAIKDRSSKKLLTSQRGYCSHCGSILWFNISKCSYKHTNSQLCDGNLVKPVSTEQIVDYLVSDSLPGSSCGCASDSEDSDDESLFKLWAYPNLC